MPHYQVNRESFRHNGERKTFGDTVVLSEAAAAPYLVREALLPVSEGFTPTEPSNGVVSVQDDIRGADSANAESRPSAGNEAQPGGGESPAAGAVHTPTHVILQGSDVQPAYIDINGDQVQLGTVVARAYELSGITSADAWNALDPEQCEAFIENAIGAMRAQATISAPAAEAAPAAPAAPTRPRRSRAK